MGIYTQRNIERQGDLVVIKDSVPGQTLTQYYQLILQIDERTDCFCCSCGDREGSDAACRNHGFAATRPCEDHDMPGSEWDAMTAPGEQVPPWHGTMPESVQWIRARDRWYEERYQKADPRCIGKNIFERVCTNEDPHSHWPLHVEMSYDNG